MAQIYGQPTAAERTVTLGGQILLAVLLAATLFVAARSDPRVRGSVADEATYTMQALSLAGDLDLAFELSDFERYVEIYGRPPAELVLVSRDGGERISYGVPFLGSLLAAPLMLLWPLEGPLVLNVLLLALAAWLTGRALAPRIGAAAWLVVAAFCFASVTFAYAFFALPDLFLLATTACGLALVFGRDGEPAAPALTWSDGGPRSSWARWIAAGALLAVAAVYRPVYAVVLLAAAFVTPAAERRRAVAGLAAGAALLVALAGAGQWLGGGSWSQFTGDRRAFVAATTGYPGVDFEAREWQASAGRTVGEPVRVARVAPGMTAQPPGARVWAWNLAYFWVGRDVGVLPYYLPIVLALGLAAGRRNRWLLAVAAAVAVGAFFWLRPFNFFGGREAVANRFFLPLYPALWFLAARPAWDGDRSAGRRALAALAVAALAAPFLLPLWKSPDRHPIAPDGRYAYVSDLAVRRLPFETTQWAVPSPIAEHRGLVVEAVAGDAGSRDRGETLYLRGRRPVELLIYSEELIGRLIFEFGRRAPSRLEILAGGELGDTLLRNDGGVDFSVELDRPRAEHAVIWSPRPVRIYRLRLEVPAAPPFDLPFTLATGGWQPPEAATGPGTVSGTGPGTEDPETDPETAGDAP